MDITRRARGYGFGGACPKNSNPVSSTVPAKVESCFQPLLQVSVRPYGWSLYGIHLFIDEFDRNTELAPNIFFRNRYKESGSPEYNSRIPIISAIGSSLALLAPYVRQGRIWVTIPYTLVLNERFIQEIAELVRVNELVSGSLGFVLPCTSCDINDQESVASLQRLRAAGVGVALSASSLLDLELIPCSRGTADVLIADESLVALCFGLREKSERKPWWIERAQRSGLDVVISAVNSADRLRVYAEIGIAGIFGDAISPFMTGEKIRNFLGSDIGQYPNVCAYSL